MPSVEKRFIITPVGDRHVNLPHRGEGVLANTPQVVAANPEDYQGQPFREPTADAIGVTFKVSPTGVTLPLIARVRLIPMFSQATQRPLVHVVKALTTADDLQGKVFTLSGWIADAWEVEWMADQDTTVEITFWNEWRSGASIYSTAPGWITVAAPSFF